MTVKKRLIPCAPAYAFAEAASNGLLGGAIDNEQKNWGTKVLGAFILPAPKNTQYEKEQPDNEEQYELLFSM